MAANTNRTDSQKGINNIDINKSKEAKMRSIIVLFYTFKRKIQTIF